MNQNQGQWLKIIGGSLLIALGVFSLMEAGISLNHWQLYTETGKSHYTDYHHPAGKVLRARHDDMGNIVRGIPILDNVPLLVFVGIPLVIIGIILVIKGTQEWLSR